MRTNYLIKTGQIDRSAMCFTCLYLGPDIEAHHESYLPGDEEKITWVCKSCHAEADKAARTTAEDSEAVLLMDKPAGQFDYELRS